MRFKLGTLLILAGFVAACAPQKPSATMAENAFKADVEKRSHGQISVTRFQKTNGQDLNVLGRVGYSLEFKAGLMANAPAALDRHTAYTVPMLVPSGAPLLKTGMDYEATGRVIFEKKENGWEFSELKAERTPNEAIDAALKPPPPKSF